ncbi:MAG: PD40 domain-containing protein [Bdellovibrionales bacterium]|nr:PD40 domain-containing protein [Bdellovibrionales bacterium]
MFSAFLVPPRRVYRPTTVRFLSATLKAAVFCLLLVSAEARAQTDIRISGAQAGFPVAVPQLCNAGDAGEIATKIPEIISRNLQISGLFKVLNPATFVETPGKCVGPEGVAFSDWTVVGAEGLVRGEVTRQGEQVSVTMYLHDVQQQRTVVGKRYSAEVSDFAKVAHRFSNEILKYFTGEMGIFGTKLVFVSKVGRFKELFSMELDGSNIRQLTQDRGLALSPAWSPSGDRLVYTSYRTRSPELYLLTPRGGEPKRVTKRPGLELGAEFMPDGASLISASSLSGVTKIALFDLQGRLIRRLTEGSSIDVSPSLSPDGSKVAYTSNRAGGPQIYVIPTSGGRPTRISFTDSNYCTSPAWSPKGDKIAFVCRRGGNQLFIAGADGSQPAQLTFAGDNEDPAWSPDGRFIAFSSNFGRGGPRNIAILSLLGGTPTQITFSKAEDSAPAWSPVLE